MPHGFDIEEETPLAAMAGADADAVLVVDDDEAIRETLRLLLEDSGYRVLEAADGKTALDVLHRVRVPLVVLLDLMMPRLDGAGVLHAVAEDPVLAERHAFVLVTANLQRYPKVFQNVLHRLRVPVLRKPFDVDELLQVVVEAGQRLLSPPPQYGPRDGPVGAARGTPGGTGGDTSEHGRRVPRTFPDRH